MRVAVVLLAFLLAGCSDAKPKGGQVVPEDGFQGPTSFDRLTESLPANSTDWQDFLIIEDEVAVGNASMTFTTGRGMGCDGNLDNVTTPGRAGWVLCMARLAAVPHAMAQDVHELGIGRDLQRLTLRQAAEAVEWRALVILADSTTAYDSGWRLVDLSPQVADPIVSVDVRDPCDALDAREEAAVGGGNRGLAVLLVQLNATHGRPFVEVDLGTRSRPGPATSTPFAAHGTYDHGFVAKWTTVGGWLALQVELEVQLEAPEPPTGPTQDSCPGAVGRETQEWIIDVGIVGADGAVEYKTRTVRVDVVLGAS